MRTGLRECSGMTRERLATDCHRLPTSHLLRTVWDSESERVARNQQWQRTQGQPALVRVRHSGSAARVHRGLCHRRELDSRHLIVDWASVLTPERQTGGAGSYWM